MIEEDKKREILGTYQIPFEFEEWLFKTAQNNYMDYCKAWENNTASEEGFFTHLCSEFSVCWDNQKRREKFFQ